MLHQHATIRLSRWTIPLFYALAAVAAGLTLPRIEAHLLPAMSPISAGSAIAIYSAVASGMIALTGIVFSLTFVLIQFSATTYSPRLVLWIAQDPVLSHALGIFTATFLYAIAALAWVDRNQSGRVPFFSAWMVVALLLASVGMFVALIQRIGLLQISRMLIFTGNQGRKSINALYPPLSSNHVPGAGQSLRGLPLTQTLTHTGLPRCLQEINVEKLVRLAAASDGLIVAAAAVGDSVMERAPLLQVYGGRRGIDEKQLLKAIRLGPERSFDQDPKYAIRLLVDIAIKALSPAINDPTTAVEALGEIGDLLLQAGHRRLEIGEFHDDRGKLRLMAPFPAWEDFLQLAFDEISTYGATSVQVMRRMKALISDLTPLLPEERQVALKQWQARLNAIVARSFPDPEAKQEALVEDRQGIGMSRGHSASL
ncbi:MAG TPA: DUF2254 domain-containing protein [Candidatus Limnocylindrales bacterium]|nr:DUF2254 domain-containing protein [Candidatus Limnocylindrales bacterium]